MFKKVLFRAYLLAVLFGGTAVLVALSEGTVGLLVLLIGCIGGIIATERHIPNLLKEWERTGEPGVPKTPEQQEQWDREKGQRQRNQNLAVIVGLSVVALLRSFFRDSLLLVVPLAFGGVTMYFLRVGWLVHRKQSRLSSDN